MSNDIFSETKLIIHAAISNQLDHKQLYPVFYVNIITHPSPKHNAG